MSVSLPDLIDPRKAVAQSATYEGLFEIARLPRLVELLWQPDGGSTETRTEGCTAAFRLEFGRDEDGRSVVTGHLASRLPLRCQRCGQRYDLPVETEIRLALVAGIDEARRLPERYEPLLVEERLMRPSELIEDELILAIPAIPRHPDGQCEQPAVPERPASGATETSTQPAETVHPFASLATLRARENDDKDQD
jgi:uncharacterized protein